MAQGDTYRQIGPNDKLIFDSSNNLVGIQNSNAKGSDLNVTGLSTLVSGAGTVAPSGYVSRLLYNASPNLTLNDTSGGAGTTATPFGQVLTIPGGYMGANSAVRLWGAIDWVGGNSKSVIVKVGQASDTWTSASTVISGQAGLSTQRYTPLGAIIWNDGVTNQQRGNPNGSVHWFNSSTGAVAGVANINTALDWNIWVGVQFGVLNGGDTATLRRLILELLP